MLARQSCHAASTGDPDLLFCWRSATEPRDAVADPPQDDTFGAEQGDTFGPPAEKPPAPPPGSAPAEEFAPPGKLRQPPGLWCLFVTEMWERFSYYGMRAILILYLTEPLAGMQDAASTYQPGRGLDVAAAAKMYGWYTGLVWLMPIIGGLIADRIIGTHRSMLTGAFLIMLGHITLALSGLGALAQNEAGMAIFVGGLALIVLGTGHFKPCVSVMVGQLYGEHDPRRDGGFTIFYMGINVGAFICPFICGTLGEKVGWHWGFGSAAVGMFLGVIAYTIGRPLYLEGIGGPPPGRTGRSAWMFFVGSIVLAALFGWFYYAGGPGAIGDASTALTHAVDPYLLLALGLVAIVGLSAWFVAAQEPADRGPVFTIICFIFFSAFFWMAFEQAGSSLNIFARDNTDRMLFGWQMPASYFQSVNPLLIILLAPLYAQMWSRLGKRGLNPTQSLKIAYGLFLLAGGYCFMVIAGGFSAGGVKVAMWWLAATYAFHTMGELCLSPTGLSFVTKASPAKWVSFLMGIWFLSSFVANLGGGVVAGYIEKIESGEVQLFWYRWFQIGGAGDFFLLFVIGPVAAGLVVLALTPLYRRLLHGIE
jgi:POT family proton-dependent oligopeptide transporter